MQWRSPDIPYIRYSPWSKLTILRRIPDEPTPICPSEGDNPLAWVLSAPAASIYQHVLGAPEERVDPTDPVIHELLDSGFAHAVWGDPTRLIALPPDIAITRAIAARTRHWLSTAPDVDAAQHALLQYRRITPSKTTTAGTSLDTSDARQQASAIAFASARTQVCLMQPYPAWMPEQVRDDAQASAPVEPDTLQLGVAYRYIYDERILADPHFRKMALEEVDLGAQARVATTLPTWMMIVDNSVALYLPDPLEPSGALSNASGHVTLLQTAFEAAWTGAWPLAATRAATDLTETHREILMLMIAGNGYETIARMMRVNPKTVRRKVDDLCSHFGVRDKATLIATALSRTG